MPTQLISIGGHIHVNRVVFLSILLGVTVAAEANNWPSQTVCDGSRVGQYTSLEILDTGEPAICFYDYADGDLEYAWAVAGQWYAETVDSQGDVGAYSSMILLTSGQIAVTYLDLTTTSLKCAWLNHGIWRTEVVDPDAAAGYTCVRELPSGQPAVSYAGENSAKYAWFDGSQWHLCVVDAVPVGAGQTSLAIVAGKPAMTYYDSRSKDLKYAEGASINPGVSDVWTLSVIDSEGDVGQYNSLAVSLGGEPGVCYYDKTNQDLKYTILESSPFGLKTWAVPTIIDADGDVGTYCSLVTLNGLDYSDLIGTPLVSYFHRAEDQLKFAWFDGTDWQKHVVDTAGWVGRYTSMKLLPSGDPAISYNLSGDLAAVKFSCFHGFGWYTDTVLTSQLEGRYASLKILPSGGPAISYRDVTNGHLRYSRWDGAAWQSETVDEGNGTGLWASLALVSGQPAISYQDISGGNKLKYGRFDGGNWLCELVDASYDSGDYSSLAVGPADGLPRISYTGNDDLRYAWFDGAAWHASIVIDGDGDVGYYTSLAFLPSGAPAISYWDRTNTNLKYAVLTGSDESNPGHWKTEVVDSVKDVGEWTSLAVWNGQPAISYYDSTNQHLKFAWHAGGVWNTTTVDSGAKTGQYTSLKIIQGAPAIAYRSNGNLKCARLVGANPGVATDWQFEIVDDEADLGYCSLSDLGGYPAVAYWDNSHCDLKFAVAP